MLPRAEHRTGILRMVPERLNGVGLYRLGERLTPSPARASLMALTISALVLALMHLQAR